MTVRQEAYSWIDRLPEESVQALIQVMRRMTIKETAIQELTGVEECSPKMRAFDRMQSLRRETANYELSDAQRSVAMEEKYGSAPALGGVR